MVVMRRMMKMMRMDDDGSFKVVKADLWDREGWGKKTKGLGAG